MNKPGSNCAPLSPKLQSGLEIVNAVDANKFHMLLNRIAHDIQTNPDLNSPFTEEQEEKLMESFCLDRQLLSLLVQSSIFILRQAIYNFTTVERFQIELSQHLKLEDEKVATFLSVWSKNAKSLIKTVKEKPIFLRNLDNLCWLVDIETASSLRDKHFRLRSILELDVIGAGGDASSIVLDLREPVLVTMFEALEDVQESLDALC